MPGPEKGSEVMYRYRALIFKVLGVVEGAILAENGKVPIEEQIQGLPFPMGTG